MKSVHDTDINSLLLHVLSVYFLLHAELIQFPIYIVLSICLTYCVMYSVVFMLFSKQ